MTNTFFGKTVPVFSKDNAAKETIRAVLEAASFAGWTSPYEREGAMDEHVERVAERLESKGYIK
jgi:hypothetical protein